MDHGPGLLEPFLNQLWTLLKGVGLRIAGLASRIGGLLDWLAEAVGSDIVWDYSSSIVSSIGFGAFGTQDLRY